MAWRAATCWDAGVFWIQTAPEAMTSLLLEVHRRMAHVASGLGGGLVGGWKMEGSGLVMRKQELEPTQ
jgi:hypothetical protein